MFKSYLQTLSHPNHSKTKKDPVLHFHDSFFLFHPTIDNFTSDPSQARSIVSSTGGISASISSLATMLEKYGIKKNATVRHLKRRLDSTKPTQQIRMLAETSLNS